MQFIRTTQKLLSARRYASDSLDLVHRNVSPYGAFYHENSARKFPVLVYVPHVFRWLTAKVKMKYLKSMWDPEFSEGAFIHGTTTAICRITDIINKNRPDLLRSLLTPRAEANLRLDMEYKLSKIQKKMIKLAPRDIKLFVPMRVQLVRDKGNNRRCLIMLKSLAMKWYEDNNAFKLVLVVLETEFKRDYTEGANPEWFISIFEVVQCVLIGSNTAVS